MLGLRGRIAFASLATAAAALLAVVLLVGPGLRSRAMSRAQDTLLAEARLMARGVADLLAGGASVESLDPLVDEAAREVRARVTIIAPDGRVLADSSVSGAKLLAVDNHGDRPEVRAALASGTGTARRHSTTVDEEMLYAAVPIRRDGRLVGVSRVAISLEDVEAQVRDLRNAVLLALVLAFTLTALLSAVVSSSLIGPLRDVMDAARRFMAGNLAARIRVRREDELGELAQILNRSADQLQERLTEIARDRGRMNAILSAMADGVLAVDHKGTVLLANDVLRDHLDLADPVARHYVEVIRQRAVGEAIEGVLRTGDRREVEVEMPHLGHAFALTGVSFPGAEGMPHGAVLTFHDVTERRRVDQVRRDFVANASHELRTPLTSIRGFVEALEDGALSDPANATRFLEKIRVHADRMAALVQDLLELSRLESGDRPPQWEEVVPADVVGDVVTSFAGLAERKSIVLTAADVHAPSVVTDADRLRRILESLVDNALKYTASGGRVEIASRPASADDGAVIEVRDNGPGIPPEHLARIFERFYRVDKARSREMGGTGLGLAIVKHLAEGMGATVTVASQVGQGTCFTVALPRRHEAT